MDTLIDDILALCQRLRTADPLTAEDRQTLLDVLYRLLQQHVALKKAYVALQEQHLALQEQYLAAHEHYTAKLRQHTADCSALGAQWERCTGPPLKEMYETR